jgi:hypothetical protein
MSRNTKWFLAIVFAFVGIAWGLTKTTSLWIVNSQIDSTPIGQNTPAAGAFVSVLASEGGATTGGYSFSQDYGYDTGMFSPADGVLDFYANGVLFMHNTSIGTSFSRPVNLNNGVNATNLTIGSGLNALPITPGTSAPSRRGITFGADPAGDLTLWVSSLQINPGVFIRDTNGGLSYGAFTPTGSLLATGAGNASGLLNSQQGAYVMWNLTNGTGETDFVNQRDGSPGGFNWYNTGSGSIGSPIMSLNSSGALTASSFNGPLNGTATTAGALSNTPSQCGSGSYATGIQSNGNANCVPKQIVMALTGGQTCTTGGGTGAQCQSTYTWPSSFPDTNYSASCTGDNLSANGTPGAVIDIVGKTMSGITVRITSTTSASQSFGGIECIGVHN